MEKTNYYDGMHEVLNDETTENLDQGSEEYFLEYEALKEDESGISEWLRTWGREQQECEAIRNQELLTRLQNMSSSVGEIAQAIRAQTQASGQVLNNAFFAASFNSHLAEPQANKWKSSSTTSITTTDTAGTVIYTQNPNVPILRGKEERNLLRFLAEFETYCRQLKIPAAVKLITIIDSRHGLVK